MFRYSLILLNKDWSLYVLTAMISAGPGSDSGAIATRARLAVGGYGVCK